jgi:hypothetical protein
MTLCSCCYGPIRSPVIRTRAGAIFPGLGLCRPCWRLVGRVQLRALRRARLDYMAMPLLAQALGFYTAWEDALTQATARRVLLRRVA